MIHLSPRQASLRKVAVLICAFSLASCNSLSFLPSFNSLSDEDEARLDSFKLNSKEFYAAEDYPRAENASRKGLRLDPDDMSLNLVLGFSLLRQNASPLIRERHINEAVTVFEKCREIEDEFDVRVQLGLGEAYYQRGLSLENLITNIQNDEKITPEERSIEIGKLTEERDESYSNSENALLETLNEPRYRDNFTARSTMARLYATLGRYQDAADVLRGTTNTLASSIRIWEEQMETESLDSERRAAYKATRDQLVEQQVMSLGLLSLMAFKLERWEEVVSVYARLDAMEAMQPMDFFNRARAYERMSARAAAIQDYETFYRMAAIRGATFSSFVEVAMRRAAQLRTGGEFKTDA